MFCKERLSNIINEEKFNEVQAIFDSWQEILEDSKQDATYASSDECKRFEQEISDVKNNVELDEATFLHVILDIKQHIASNSHLGNMIINDLLDYYFSDDTLYHDYIDFVEFCVKVWSLLNKEQKNAYYNDLGTIEFLDRARELGYFECKWLENEHYELLLFTALEYLGE